MSCRHAVPRRAGGSFVFVACLLLAGCASLPDEVDRPISTAIEDHESTTLGKLFSEEEALHPCQSGFFIASNSVNAFRTRIAMIRLAERSLDVQYYIWDADTTGGIMALELLDALWLDHHQRLAVTE